jgi:hypothetical protein
MKEKEEVSSKQAITHLFLENESLKGNIRVYCRLKPLDEEPESSTLEGSIFKVQRIKSPFHQVSSLSIKESSQDQPKSKNFISGASSN